MLPVCCYGLGATDQDKLASNPQMQLLVGSQASGCHLALGYPAELAEPLHPLLLRPQ